MTNEEMIQEVLDIKEALGKTPTYSEFIEYSSSKRLFISRFGSYRALLAAAGLEPTRRKITRELILEWVYSFYVTNKRIPGREETRRQFKESFIGYFGSYEQMIKEAADLYGFTVHDEDLLPRLGCKKSILKPENKSALRKNIIRELKDLRSQYPTTPVSTLIKMSSFQKRTVYAIVGHGAEIEALIGKRIKDTSRKEPTRPTIPAADVRSDAIHIARKYPALSITMALSKFGKYSISTYYKYLGNADNIRKVVYPYQQINKTQKYAIRYSAAPTTLKWMKKRSPLTEL